MQTSKKVFTAAALLALSASASALVIDRSNIGVGTTGVDGNGFTSFASGVMDTKAAGPYTGVGVSGYTNGEIDFHGSEFIGLKFDEEQVVSSFRVGLLYNGPEYGDVKEVARITADGHAYLLQATGVEGLARWVDTWTGSFFDVRYELGTAQGQGAVINLANPFGNELIGSLTFAAGRGLCYAGSCTNQSDYNLVNVNTVSPVPEPSTYALMLAGLGMVGWIARRRPQ